MASLSGKNVVVTGAAGFIGSHLCDEILKSDAASVVGCDNLFLGKLKNLSAANEDSRFSFVEQDVSDFGAFEKLLRSSSADYLFHLAVVPLEVSLENPDWGFAHNVDISRSVCEAVRKCDSQPKLISFSSSEVYGTAQYTPMDEAHPLLPHTPYAAAKAAADHLVYSYGESFGLRYVTPRPFNNFGPRQNEGSYAGLIPKTMKRILDGQPPIVFGSGEQARDFVYVGDTARAAIRLALSDQVDGKVINLASGAPRSVNEVVNTLCKCIGFTEEWVRGERRAGDVDLHHGCCKLGNSLVGFDVQEEFSLAMARTCDWYCESLGKSSSNSNA